jgi:hypothetical protein
MTVKELIEALKSYPDDALVYFKDCTTLREIEVHAVRESENYSNIPLLYNDDI